jgi:broad specificity phosphatase PhoE
MTVTSRRRFLTASLTLTAGNVLAAAPPKLILLIRHAEKNNDKSDPHLNSRGFQRAAALPRLFPGRFPTPDFIFATHASAHSNRPVETVTPLAKSLRMSIHSQFANEEYKSIASHLATDTTYSGKVLLVCWHHGNIPGLASALGVSKPPSPWPDNQFDHVWRMEFSGGVVLLEDLPQRLLQGDS